MAQRSRRRSNSQISEIGRLGEVLVCYIRTHHPDGLVCSSYPNAGIVATEDLAEDEELFSIPRSSILTSETSSVTTSLRKGIWEGQEDPWILLIFAMVLEHLKDSDSQWKPYFDILPEKFDTPMFWTDTELTFLEGSAVIDKIGRAGADKMFQEQLLPAIGQAMASLKLPNPRSNDELLALCHRMGSTIMAYAFDLEEPLDQPVNPEDGWEEDEQDADIIPKGMVPLADMLNADADRNNAKLFYVDDKVVMKTIKAVKSGEELYNDFGPLPRADLLRRYGYVTENYAKYDVVEISSDLIKRSAQEQLKIDIKDLDEKWSYAEEQGVLDDGYDISRAGSEEGQFNEELRDLLNLLATPKAEFDKMRKKDKLPKPELSTDAKALLRTVLVHRYAMYPPESGMHLEITNEVSERRRQMAIQIVGGEKQVIREAVEAVTGSDSKKRKADTLESEAAAVRNPTKK